MESASLELPASKRHITMVLADSAGVIEFIPNRLEPSHEGHYTDPRAGGANLLGITSFIYSVHELEKLDTFVRNGSARRQEWLDTIEEKGLQLEDEEMKHDDLLFVDMVDVYRHIPLKLIRFYEWLSEEMNFNFAMKTDDDCFVDVERLLEAKTKHKVSSGRLWWGRFRQAWAVEHYGKWAELQYPSIAYPTFACGSGNLLSADLIHWVAHNADSLNMYQGEDVSLGIWMAALAPKLLDDPLFQCEKQCLSEMITLPDLSPPELYQIWEDKQACGDPCGCN